MPATQSQSTRVKPRNSQRCARSATRQGLVTPGHATCVLIVARVPWRAQPGGSARRHLLWIFRVENSRLS
jgi:hypothetical protein